MKSISHLSVAALALGLALLGCSKDEKKNDKPAEEKASAVETADDQGAGRVIAPAAKKSEGDAKPMPVLSPAAPVAAVSGSDAAAAGFDMMHKDMNLVVGLGLNSLRQNPAYQMAKPFIQKQLHSAVGSKYGTYVNACGFDPIDAVASVMGGGNIEDRKDGFVVTVTGIERSRLQSCLKGISALKNEKVTVVDDGDITTFTARDEDPLHVAWTNDSTMIVAAKQSKEQLGERLAGKDGMSGNALMSELLGRVNTKSTLWGAGTPKPKQNKEFSFEPQGIYGSLDMSAGLAIQIGMRVQDEAEAKKASAEIQRKMNGRLAEMKNHPMAATAGKYAAKMKVATDGAYVTVGLDLTMADVMELVGLASGLMNMGGMTR